MLLVIVLPPAGGWLFVYSRCAIICVGREVINLDDFKFLDQVKSGAASVVEGSRSLSQNEVALQSASVDVINCLKDVFDDFLATIKKDETVGMVLASFGAVREIIVTDVSSLKSNLIRISGLENGQPVSLIQHVTQLNFLLVPVPLADSQERPTIGFH